MNRTLTFEECLREEFLINTDNYPKEYHKLFSGKFNRAKRRFEEQKSVEQMNRQDLDYQQDNEQQSGNKKWLERFYEILNKSDKYEFILHSDKEFFANELFEIAKEYAASQNNK